MDLYNRLKLKPVRTDPEVWVRRLVIYEKIAPEPVVIREVHLSKGLNIVWAEEPEDDNSSAEIAGHSAGKTTFCRLLRYVLGENTFGTRANMGLIEKSIPEGYVAAEICVRQKWWAVIRPIGVGRNSYIKPSATIEELLPDKSHPAFQENYAERIGLNALLDGLETGAVVRTNEKIQWGHLLAWCTRDQEARFQNIYEWRSPRSESNAPAFRFSRADPLFVMRTLLGLFLPDELKGEESLAKLLQDRERLVKRLEDLKREPQFRVNLYDKELRQRLQAIFPDNKGIADLPLHSGDLFSDLDRLTDEATSPIDAQVANLEIESKKLQDGIDALGGQIVALQGRRNTLDTLFKFEGAAIQELDDGLNQRKKARQLLDQFGEANCIMGGGILYNECDYVKKYQKVLRISQVQDAHAMEQAEAKRTEAQQALDLQKKRLDAEVVRLSSERGTLQTDRNNVLTQLRAKREEARDLVNTRTHLVSWTTKATTPGEFKEMDLCQKELKETEEKIERLKAHLDKLIKKHDGNRELIASIFSGAVKAVLTSGTYDGQVGLPNRELEFRITHGPAMSGEAIETLSVLLADLACLVYNSASERALHLGFLVHDSPREADLGLRIYRSFIRFVVALQAHFGKAEKCPFQYILTTTTPPPQEIQGSEFVKLRLNASIESELILRRNVARAASQEDSLLK